MVKGSSLFMGNHFSLHRNEDIKARTWVSSEHEKGIKTYLTFCIIITFSKKKSPIKYSTLFVLEKGFSGTITRNYGFCLFIYFYFYFYFLFLLSIWISSKTPKSGYTLHLFFLLVALIFYFLFFSDQIILSQNFCLFIFKFRNCVFLEP